jgi:RNA-directed DNA polymerase
MVLLAQTERAAQEAWHQLQGQFAALHLVVNQEKSRLTTLAEGFAFLGFEFRKAPGRMLCMWPREKACRNIRQGVREVARSFPSNGHVDVVIQKLNPVLNGWCTYFRVGNSNRAFHKVDWAVGVSCSYGSGVSISAAGGLPRNDGNITFFMNDVGCTAW